MASPWSFLWLEPWWRTIGSREKVLYLTVALHPKTSVIGTLSMSDESLAYECGLRLANLTMTLHRLQARAPGELQRDGDLYWVSRYMQASPLSTPRLVRLANLEVEHQLPRTIAFHDELLWAVATSVLAGRPRSINLACPMIRDAAARAVAR